MIDSNYLIDCEALNDLLGSADIRIVDCRFDLKDPSSGYRQFLDGHIPGAVHADLDNDLAGPATAQSGRHPLPATEAFERAMSHLGIGPTTKVVCYDQASGALAARLWWLLRWAGHDNACMLDGGITRWLQLDLALETGEADTPSAKFRASPCMDKVVTTAEIVDEGAAELRLVDARDEQRFLGHAEPIDPVAGHIPGSINVPFGSSLEATGTWKDPESLRGLWRDVLGDSYGKPWSVMCGSGVTACHLVASALMAGLPEPRVYVGSWSEWIADPERPVSGGPGVV